MIKQVRSKGYEGVKAQPPPKLSRTPPCKT